MQGTPMPMTVD
jgi:hypothetical protein